MLVFCWVSFVLSAIPFAGAVPSSPFISAVPKQAIMVNSIRDSVPKGAEDLYWRASIKHQGTSAFHPNPSSYQVFRNVKDYGAKGDGVTDDSAAINRAISDGNRCGGGECSSSTLTPAVVYFPPGDYLLKNSITPYYYTQLLGDAKNPPVLLADESFHDIAVIDADPYIPGGGGRQWFVNQNNFYRSVKNFVIDVRRVPANVAQGTGIHWQVSQGTSLQNIIFQMSSDPNTTHQGIWMENGSGGFMGDLVFNGGKFAIWCGNQQFTVRNVVINNAQIGVYGLWNWGWTFQGITFNNCGIGFDLATGGTTPSAQSVGAETIIDAVASNTQTFLRTSKPSVNSLAGSLVLNNIELNNVQVAVGVVGQSQPVLDGNVQGRKVIETWVQGNVYKGSDTSYTFTQGEVPPPYKAPSLLNNDGTIVSRGRPQYEDYSLDQIVSVKDQGAKGDGQTDDTKALQTIFDKYANDKLIFVDAGTYLITSTLVIPSGSRITGEAWSIFAATGSYFADGSNPQVAVKVGNKGDKGIIEISDIIFSTKGPTPGAIMVEWNIAEPDNLKAGAGMWDTHFRLGGADGTDMQSPPGCTDYQRCSAAFLSLHITETATAYLEPTWIWVADHDLDNDGMSQLAVYAGRGILSESQGPVWMIGTSEHHTIYQYRLANAKNHYLGLIQTESPYNQPVPAAPAPFSLDPGYNDPSFPNDLSSSWGLSIANSQNIFINGAGLYSFFNDYSIACTDQGVCQQHIVDIDDNSSVQLYSLSTVGTRYPISVGYKGVARNEDNANGFADTVTVWTSG